jgi:hypothetical protein
MKSTNNKGAAMKDYDPAIHAPTDYYKIVFRTDDAKRPETVVIKEPKVSDDAKFITGRQVDVKGNNAGSTKVTSVLHIIDVCALDSSKGDAITRMAMNKHYGWLEEVNPTPSVWRDAGAS